MKILLEEVSTRLAEHNLNLTLTAPAVALLVEKGFDPRMGARPLRRAIQRLIEDPLAELVLAGKFKEGAVVRIGRRGDELTFDEKDRESEEQGERIEQGA